ncbi:MAG: hypothetical protein N3F07_03470 [Candidatus Micrarchaeota archaeon]|nr:hypothetical protein [Candidatus Micrarchaeota archaeon]
MPGQASAELLAVLGIALFLILFVAAFASDSLAGSRQQDEIRQAREAVQNLAQAADYVYSQGEGASLSVRVSLPASADYSPEKTYIGKPAFASANASSNAININIYGSDISAYSKAPLAGAFPSQPGAYSLNVTSQGGIVSIGKVFAVPEKTSIYVRMGKGQSRTEFVSFKALHSGPIILNATYSWQFSSPSLSIPTPILVAYNSSAQIPLAFLSHSSAGIYTGDLFVRVYAAGSPPALKEQYKLPITLEVS